MTFEEFRTKWYSNDCFVRRSKLTFEEYDKEQEKLFNQALADERTKIHLKGKEFMADKNEKCKCFDCFERWLENDR